MAFALCQALFWASGWLASAEEAGGAAERLRQLSDIELHAFQKSLRADDLQVLSADFRDPQPALAVRAAAIYAGAMTGLAQQYVVALEILASRRLPAVEVRTLVDAAKSASPDGSAPGLAALDLGRVAGTPDQVADDLTIEVARWYMAVGRADLAAPLITAASQSVDELLAIRAAELGADLLAGQRRFGDAIPGYEYAQSLIDRLHHDANGYERKTDWHGFDQVLALRIAAKVMEARRRADLDRYGAGYVAYREAEALRVTAHDAMAALVKHQRLQVEQAGSIFASAARSAVVKCLISLAACTEKSPPASAYLDRARQRLLELKTALASLALLRAVPAAMTEAKAAVDQQEEELRRLAKVPVGAPAAAHALEIVHKVGAKDQDDPYLGEMFYDIGKDVLERSGVPEGAQGWLNQSIEWCHRTARNRGVPANLGLNEAARQISAPPPSERMKDGWGNHVWQGPKVGDLFNPVTCSWYLVWLERNARVYDGLGHFAMGDFAAAKERWASLPQIDTVLAADEEAGRGSLYNHLMWDVENNDGALYATPKEMALFVKPTLRMAVFLADLDYEAERQADALARYRAILDDAQWILTENQRAYLLYALANCLHYTQQTEQAIATLDAFVDGYGHAPTRPRALYGLGNICLRTPSAAGEAHAEAAFSRLLKDYPDDPQAAAGLYVLGWYYGITHRPRESSRWLKLYLERFPSGHSAAAARKRLADLAPTKP